jgi:hypothetical protein
LERGNRETQKKDEEQTKKHVVFPVSVYVFSEDVRTEIVTVLGRKRKKEKKKESINRHTSTKRNQHNRQTSVDWMMRGGVVKPEAEPK